MGIKYCSAPSGGGSISSADPGTRKSCMEEARSRPVGLVREYRSVSSFGPSRSIQQRHRLSCGVMTTGDGGAGAGHWMRAGTCLPWHWFTSIFVLPLTFEQPHFLFLPSSILHLPPSSPSALTDSHTYTYITGTKAFPCHPVCANH
jgi:hypothetical protein